MIDRHTTLEDEVASYRNWMARFSPDIAGSDLIRWVIRFALPVSSHAAVVTDGDRDLLWIGTMTTPFEFDLADETLDPETLIKGLERLASQGAGFLLLPSSARERLSRNSALRTRLYDRFRTVVDEPDACTILAIHDEPWQRTDDNGIPLPPPEMVHITAGMFDRKQIYDRFLSGGEAGMEGLAGILDQHGVDPRELGSILDYGSGCGRVIRHWPAVTDATLFGSDYNPFLVEWCQQNLEMATFRINGIGPSLAFDDDSFDLVYSVSVFTHLTEPLQLPWMQELIRVTRPGGHLLLTLHGESRADLLEADDRERFANGELVVSTNSVPGTSNCAAFHPDKYIRDVFAADLEVIAILPNGATFAQQDAVLLRKPA
jgi:SAM-dependent methyltransferase